jgi:hypothetical protein
VAGIKQNVKNLELCGSESGGVSLWTLHVVRDWWKKLIYNDLRPWAVMIDDAMVELESVVREEENMQKESCDGDDLYGDDSGVEK